MDSLKIALVDDDPILLEELPTVLAPHGILVLWTANSGDIALTQLSKADQRPDVLVVDVRMPGLSGHELTDRVTSLHPDLHVLMYTSIDSEDSFRDALACGALGYVVKHDPPERVVPLLRLAASGQLAVSESPARMLTESFCVVRPDVSPLTARQREVLKLASEGNSNEAIASKLGCSVNTVKKHFSAIFHRLDAHDRASAVFKAIHAGIL
ncbi:response regulator [Tessaracoccus caeni]|uniref:response regulator n=1 Tax=Tessaracoccus caeni TaxID=3031239 RepID=UPI0023D9A489|nr:response regulator transcription factor [Tessaracoccus caeni]MDF1488634.1 response regulator transcription factor [Tessaracoccus caeni]